LKWGYLIVLQPCKYATFSENLHLKKMAVKKTASKYAVLHYRDGRTRINLCFTDGSRDDYYELSPQRTMLLVDMLRNEKPVYRTEGHDILWTGREPVGE
jgi:hypothetical protein